MYFVNVLPEIIFIYPCLSRNNRCVEPVFLFVSTFWSFRRPATIIHDLQKYESASSSWHKRRGFSFHTTASSPSIAEAVPSKGSTVSISSSMIFCCFWIKSLDLFVWWFCYCWYVGGTSVPLLVVLDFLAFCFIFIFLFLIYLLFTIRVL